MSLEPIPELDNCKLRKRSSIREVQLPTATSRSETAFEKGCSQLKKKFSDLEFCETFNVDGTTTCMLEGIKTKINVIEGALPMGFRLEIHDNHVNLVYEPSKLEKKIKIYLSILLLILIIILVGFIAFHYEKYKILLDL